MKYFLSQRYQRFRKDLCSDNVLLGIKKFKNYNFAFLYKITKIKVAGIIPRKYWEGRPTKNTVPAELQWISLDGFRVVENASLRKLIWKHKSIQILVQNNSEKSSQEPGIRINNIYLSRSCVTRSSKLPRSPFLRVMAVRIYFRYHFIKKNMEWTQQST